MNGKANITNPSIIDNTITNDNPDLFFSYSLVVGISIFSC